MNKFVSLTKCDKGQYLVLTEDGKLYVVRWDGVASYAKIYKLETELPVND